jgi:predicted transcriptional regulator
MAAAWSSSIARKMRENGRTYEAIADYFGIASTTVRARLNPQYAAAHNEAVKASRRKRRAADEHFAEAAQSRRAADTKPARSHVRALVDDAEAYRQLAAMQAPRYRGIVGLLMGDPPIGRSALDMRKQQETRI